MGDSKAQSSGSQDSIDLEENFGRWIEQNGVKLGDLSETPFFGFVNSSVDLNTLKAAILAWHNTQLKATQQRAEKYDELIMAVGNKFEGETRHQTALRYIQTAENQDKPPMQSNLEKL